MQDQGATYLNPVYDQSSPDPFALKYLGEYWCYSTGFQPDGRCFGILHSPDLVHWEYVGSALDPLPEGWPNYWAPEVHYEHGIFYMYYSAGNELPHMEIRVATASHPAGPFSDSGRCLTREEFAIDPHVFVDSDGTRYLFYAVDFLEYHHIGTGTVMDRMLDPFTLAGQPHPVTRALYDWQVYDPHRIEKGGVRWHTVEGSFVLKHKGLYYQMFSGGNWQNISYGVGYAVTRDIDTPDEWNQVVDGLEVQPVLRTIPGKVIGPGHNSVVRGPDNRQLYCVYHRWSANNSARVLAIDPLDFACDRLLVIGPSTTPQPAPLRPSLDGFTDNWRYMGGDWQSEPGQAVQRAGNGTAAARRQIGSAYYLFELSTRAHSLADSASSVTGEYGIVLRDRARDEAVVRLSFLPHERALLVDWIALGGKQEQRFALPSEFKFAGYQLLHVELNRQQVRIQLNGSYPDWTGVIAEQHACDELELFTQESTAEFAAFQLAYGWQDLFIDQSSTLQTLGWQMNAVSKNWLLQDQQLWCLAGEAQAESVFKGELLAAYEFAANVRLAGISSDDGCYGFYPATGQDDPGPLLQLMKGEAGWVLQSLSAAGAQTLALPAGFDPLVCRQFRMSKQGGMVSVYLEAEPLGTITVPAQPARIGLYVRKATAAFDMVRVTAIEEP